VLAIVVCWWSSGTAALRALAGPELGEKFRYRLGEIPAFFGVGQDGRIVEVEGG
jgi:hypothetical protein